MFDWLFGSQSRDRSMQGQTPTLHRKEEGRTWNPSE